MEDSTCLEAAPASSNLVMEELSGFQLTRSNSDAASSLSADNFGDILQPNVHGRPDKCMAWTDEKHDKYLDSLEASFVRQLNRSRDLLSRCKEQNRGYKDLSRRLPISVHKASEQFPILRGGAWQKVIIEKDQPISYIATIKVPWMHCQGLAEGSGQNFVDEYCEDNSNGNPSAKRLKTAVEDTSSADQIVSSGKFFAFPRSIITNPTLEGQAYDDESSENSNNLVHSQIDVKSQA